MTHQSTDHHFTSHVARQRIIIIITMSSDNGLRQEKLFKLLVVGDSLVGKTAFVRRYVQGRYEDNYKVTVGGNYLGQNVQFGGV